MKRICFILCIITFLLTFSGCRRVNVTSADEMIYNHWQVENPNSVNAELKFDTEISQAQLKIIDENKKEIIIKGTFAVDCQKLYIISTDLYETYIFDYTVFKDRLILTYNSVDLEFSAQKEIEPQVTTAQ